MKACLLAVLVPALLIRVDVMAAPDHPIAAAVAAKLSDPRRKFTMIVKLKVREGADDRLVAAFEEATGPTREEKGCSRYELNQVEGEPGVFYVYERWSSLERLNDHLATPHARRLLQTIHPLLAADPEVTVLVPRAEPAKPGSTAEKVETGLDEIRDRLDRIRREGSEEDPKKELKRALEDAKKELRKQLEKDR